MHKTWVKNVYSLCVELWKTSEQLYTEWYIRIVNPRQTSVKPHSLPKSSTVLHQLYTQEKSHLYLWKIPTFTQYPHPLLLLRTKKK